MYSAVRKRQQVAPKHCPTSHADLGKTRRGEREGFSWGQGGGTGCPGCCSGRKSLRTQCLLTPPHPGTVPPMSYFDQRFGEERGIPANPRVEEGPAHLLCLARLSSSGPDSTRCRGF